MRKRIVEAPIDEKELINVKTVERPTAQDVVRYPNSKNTATASSNADDVHWQLAELRSKYKQQFDEATARMELMQKDLNELKEK